MSRYNPKLFDKLAGTLAGLGYTHVQMATDLGIARGTFDAWRKEYPSFNEAIVKGKQDADEIVVQSLYQRACGYSHEDVDIKIYQGKIIKTKFTKHYPPDPTSMIFWLKNRDRNKWREKVNIIHGVDDSEFIKQTPADIAKQMDNSTAPVVETAVETEEKKE